MTFHPKFVSINSIINWLSPKSVRKVSRIERNRRRWKCTTHNTPSSHMLFFCSSIGYVSNSCFSFFVTLLSEAPDKINGIIYGWAVWKFIKLNSIFYLFVCICICLVESAPLRLLPACARCHRKKRIICRSLVNRKSSLNCILIHFKIMFILLTTAIHTAIWYRLYATAHCCWTEIYEWAFSKTVSTISLWFDCIRYMTNGIPVSTCAYERLSTIKKICIPTLWVDAGRKCFLVGSYVETLLNDVFLGRYDAEVSPWTNFIMQEHKIARTRWWSFTEPESAGDSLGFRVRNSQRECTWFVWILITILFI